MTDEALVPNYDFLAMMAGGPPSQIDPSMAKLLEDLDGRPTDEVKAAIHKALDFGVHCGACSQFVLAALDVEWRRLGGRSDDPAPWRDEWA